MNSDKLKELLEKNSNYWQSRALDTEIRAVENEEDYLKRIKGIYDAAQRDIEKKMANVYARYASNNKITLKEAYKQLPKKMETEYKADVNEYIRLAQEHQGDPKWKQYLLNQSLMHKHSVLNQLQTEYRKVIYDIDMEETAGKFLEKIYTNTSYYNQYLNNDEVFAKVDKDRIQSLINENWSGGGSFSENIWGNKEKLIKALDETVIRGMAIGRSFNDMAKELAKKMDTGYNNAARLIMTESARMDNMSLLDTYKRMGVQKLEFVATLDMKTSEICRAMDGTIIDIENAKIGLNVPPLHPYCRSVIAPVMDEEIDKGGDKRIYRDVNTGKSVMGRNRNYIDYLKEELGDEKQAQAIASTRNDLATLVAAVNTPPNPTTGVSASDLQASRELLEANRDHYERDKERYHIDEEVEKQAVEEMKKLIDESELATRTNMDNLDSILESGRIKTQFEDGVKSSTMVERDYRADIEQQLFGYKLNLNPKLRPVYGYLTNRKFDISSKNGACQYGNVCIVLKKSKVFNRTTYTVGDSLDGIRSVLGGDYFYAKVPAPLSNPSIKTMEIGRSIRDGKFGDSLEKVTESVNYMEIQVHGGVSVKDIDKVYIYTYQNTWQGKQPFNIDEQLLKKLERKLKKNNIPYEVVR